MITLPSSSKTFAKAFEVWDWKSSSLIPGINKTDKTSFFAIIPKSKFFSFLDAIEEIKALSTFLFLNLLFILDG